MPARPATSPKNEGPGLTLHGGPTGTGGQNWRIEKHSDAALTLATDLPDGLGGFPGNRVLRAEFTLAAPAELVLKLTATTDAPTLMNLTNHSYWNMDGTDTTAGQIFRAAADEYLPLTARRIPTGEVADVTGTVFDFRKGRVMEARETYDMCLVFARARRAVTDIAEMIGQSGVRLRLATTEPGLQIYDMARFTSDPFVGHQGRPYPRFAGLALETHAWPDAPNHPHFPSILLQPGELLEQVTRFRFDRA